MRQYAIVSSLMVLLIASPVDAQAQSGFVKWSVLGGGFVVAASGNTKVISSVGEPFVGSSQAGENGVGSGFMAGFVSTLLSTGVSGNDGEEIPATYELSQNYPNPFNPKTVIRSQLPVAGDVSLVVYDVLGREVAVLVNEQRVAGRYQDRFDATGLASGVYFYRMQAGNFVQTRKLLLVR